MATHGFAQVDVLRANCEVGVSTWRDPLLRLLRELDYAACVGRAIPVALPPEEPELDLAADWRAIRWNFEFQEDYAWGSRSAEDDLVYPQTLGEIAAQYVKDLSDEGVFVAPRLSQREWLRPTIEALSQGAFDAAACTSEEDIALMFESGSHGAEALGFLSPACTLLVTAEFDDREAVRAEAAALPEGDGFWGAFRGFCERWLPAPPDIWKPEPLWTWGKSAAGVG